MTWLQRIKDAEDHYGFTKDDVERAGDWNYCSMSERHDVDPKKICKTYLNDAAINLGILFTRYVRYNDFSQARETHKKILSMKSVKVGT